MEKTYTRQDSRLVFWQEKSYSQLEFFYSHPGLYLLHNFGIAQKITCSFGITDVRLNDTVESIIERADSAMYCAKKDGRDCVRPL